jgi:heme/copper-type cytochrome/quinol oxidase subunit 3
VSTPTTPLPSTLDVRRLPTVGFGPQGLAWWATWGLMLIEGTAFALALAMYLYLRSVAAEWPIGAPPPPLRWGTLSTLALLASVWPNQLAKRAAERQDRRGARRWLLACLLLAPVLLALRALEFGALGVAWNINAYGSVAWLLLGLHATHLVIGTADNAVLAALLLRGPFEARHFTDLAENARYGWFIAASWLPLYGAIYLLPRL